MAAGTEAEVVAQEGERERGVTDTLFHDGLHAETVTGDGFLEFPFSILMAITAAKLGFYIHFQFVVYECEDYSMETVHLLIRFVACGYLVYEEA